MYKLKLIIFIVITDDDENSFVTEAIFFPSITFIKSCILVSSTTGV